MSEKPRYEVWVNGRGYVAWSDDLETMHEAADDWAAEVGPATIRDRLNPDWSYSYDYSRIQEN